MPFVYVAIYLNQKLGDYLGEGFSNWKRKEKLQTHVERPNNALNQACRKCEAFMKHKKNTSKHLLVRCITKARIDHYRTILGATIDFAWFLL